MCKFLSAVWNLANFKLYQLVLELASGCVNVHQFFYFLVCHFFLVTVGNENGEPVIAERQIRIMDKPLGHKDYDDGTC